MTIITISTVGFSEIVPLTHVGRMITVVIIILGISVGTYTIGVIVKWFVEGEMQQIFWRLRVKKQIADLKNHYIICGYGRIGRTICSELASDDMDFVIIEQDVSEIEETEKENNLFLEMDATTEESLLKAGIMSARGLVSVVNSDANNVFITLTARGLHPDLFILAMASEERNEEKLLKAGATRVLSPYFIGARRMAQVLRRPTVVDFIDCALTGNDLDLSMEEAQLSKNSKIVGKNLITSKLRQDFGVIIVAIKKQNGEMIYNPMPSEILDESDVIVVIGKKDDLKRMNDVL